MCYADWQFGGCYTSCSPHLKEADVVAAEDTRQSIKLLNHYEIKTPLVSYT